MTGIFPFVIHDEFRTKVLYGLIRVCLQNSIDFLDMLKEVQRYVTLWRNSSCVL